MGELLPEFLEEALEYDLFYLDIVPYLICCYLLNFAYTKFSPWQMSPNF